MPGASSIKAFGRVEERRPSDDPCGRFELQGYVAALEQDNLPVPEERFETLVMAV
jgi:hypothetical protein